MRRDWQKWPGRPFQGGRPWMGHAEWCHQATNDEGSREATICRGAGRARPGARARDQQTGPSYAGESLATLRTWISVCGKGISILFWLKVL